MALSNPASTARQAAPARPGLPLPPSPAAPRTPAPSRQTGSRRCTPPQLPRRRTGRAATGEATQWRPPQLLLPASADDTAAAPAAQLPSHRLAPPPPVHRRHCQWSPCLWTLGNCSCCTWKVAAAGLHRREQPTGQAWPVRNQRVHEPAEYEEQLHTPIKKVNGLNSFQTQTRPCHPCWAAPLAVACPPNEALTSPCISSASTGPNMASAASASASANASPLKLHSHGNLEPGACQGSCVHWAVIIIRHSSGGDDASPVERACTKIARRADLWRGRTCT
jgi:hypothetical protein